MDIHGGPNKRTLILSRRRRRRLFTWACCLVSHYYQLLNQAHQTYLIIMTCKSPVGIYTFSLTENRLLQIFQYWHVKVLATNYQLSKYCNEVVWILNDWELYLVIFENTGSVQFKCKSLPNPDKTRIFQRARAKIWIKDLK